MPRNSAHPQTGGWKSPWTPYFLRRPPARERRACVQEEDSDSETLTVGKRGVAGRICYGVTVVAVPQPVFVGRRQLAQKPHAAAGPVNPAAMMRHAACGMHMSRAALEGTRFYIEYGCYVLSECSSCCSCVVGGLKIACNLSFKTIS